MTIHRPMARGRALLFAMLLLTGGAAVAVAAEPTVSSATHWVVRGDFRLHVWEKFVDSPSGKPVVILAHGSATAGKESFDLEVPGRKDYSLMDRFAWAGFDVFALDVHGFGRSTHPEGYVTTEGAAEDLDAVVDAVRRERGVARVHVLAWSWATQYAGLFASARGDKVDRYVSYAQMHADSPDIVRRRADLELYRSNPWIVVPRDGWKARFRSLTPAEITEPEAMEAFADAAAAIETRTSTGPQLDMVTRLPMVDPARIAVPTLMIHGQYDDVADTAGLLPFFARLPSPDKRYVVIPRAGHMMHLQDGRHAFFDAVVDFLKADAPQQRRFGLPSPASGAADGPRSPQPDAGQKRQTAGHQRPRPGFGDRRRSPRQVDPYMRVSGPGADRATTICSPAHAQDEVGSEEQCRRGQSHGGGWESTLGILVPRDIEYGGKSAARIGG